MKKRDATYGKIYEGMISEGIESVMIGYIMMPAYAHPAAVSKLVEKVAGQS